MSIDCIDVNCKSLEGCFTPCAEVNPSEQPELHFELPQIVNDFASLSVEFIGSTDKLDEYKVYTDTSFRYHKYLRRGADKPYVYIQTTPNANNMYDAWVFNAPFVKKISAIIIPKDPRQLLQYDCCKGDDLENYSFIYTEIKKRLTEKKLRYYRQLYPGPVPNNQTPK
jgi:hypothetical protein